MKKISLCAAAVLGIALLAHSAQAESIKERYDNPYIDDGVMTESPFQWNKYDVLELRTEYDEYGGAWLCHYVANSEASLVKELKYAYRKQLQVAPNVYVRGFIFLTQLEVWSFTLALEGTNIHYNVIVRSHPEERGSILALVAKPRHNVNAYWKRSWFGFSPVGLDSYSASLRAY